MGLYLRCVARSHIGLVRAGNEDSGYAGTRLAVVADGMGGHAAGEVASQIAVEVLARLDDALPDEPLESLLRRSLDDADRRVADQVAEDPDLAGMGTTVTAVLSDGERLVLAQIGDSRAYLLSGGRFRQLSHDQTFVQSLIDKGRLTADEAEHHPQRNVILQAVDGQGGLEPDLTPLELAEGDRLLLCSDGLSGYVAEERIAETAAEPDAERAAEALLELALREGGPDNITVVVADVVAERPDTDPAYVGAAAQPDAKATAPAPPVGEDAAESPANGEGGGSAVDAADAADPAPPRRRRALWWGLGLGVLLLAVAGAALAGRAWLSDQWYVGESNGQVAVFQGVPESLLGISLSRVVAESDVAVDGLPASAVDVVERRSASDSLAAANATVAQLRIAAIECAVSVSPPAGCPQQAPR
jgi:protein phosphatase